MKTTTASDVRLLDNPIWNALSTEQTYLAQGNHLAKRFPKDVAPFGAMASQSAAEYQALAKIMMGDTAALFLDSPPAVPAGWSTVLSGRMYQMVFEGFLPVSSNHSFRTLTESDVPEMLALTRLTEPGPFLPNTITLGAYFGIHESGKLVAMAGERLHLTGFTEVSAVCTHPEFRGRGYGNTLLSAVVAMILSRGETPFLHVKTDNPAARLYQKLGFRQRSELHLAVIKNNDQN
jgi:ribosomal protein S18 acetylase RimI-like enzyme